MYTALHDNVRVGHPVSMHLYSVSAINFKPWFNYVYRLLCAQLQRIIYSWQYAHVSSECFLPTAAEDDMKKRMKHSSVVSDVATDDGIVHNGCQHIPRVSPLDQYGRSRTRRRSISWLINQMEPFLSERRVGNLLLIHHHHQSTHIPSVLCE